MTTFETLFGIKESRVKNTCLLMPLLRKDILKWLGVKELSRGKLYSSGNNPLFTLIHTGVGPVLLGDAVLYLDRTQCQNIILFGSCGLVKEERHLKIGSVVAPKASYSLESFSDMLLKEKKDWKLFQGSNHLLEKFLRSNKKHDIKKATCASIGSLKLEEDYIDIFKETQIQIVDMECAALFSASRYVKKNAMALFYATDIINKKPFYIDLSSNDRLGLTSSIKSAANILCKFIEKNLNA